jgi:hypothetical protein
MDESLVEAVPLSGRDPAFRVELFCDASRGEAIPTKLVDPRHQFVVAFELTELGDGPTETSARFVTADPGDRELDPFAALVDGVRNSQHRERRNRRIVNAETAAS